MSRSSSFLLLLFAGLGVFAVVYLLFGDSMGEGYGGSGYAGAGAAREQDLLGAGTATLDTKGTRPKTQAELEAERAAAEAEARKVSREEGIYGVVTDGRGHPLPGARVLMFADPPELRMRQDLPTGDPVATATTDEHGEYVVGPSPADEHARLRAEAAGFAASVQRVRRRGARVDFILDRGGALDLRVIDEHGEAVAGAVALHQAGEVVSQETTDAEGRAHFGSLPTGTGSLVVTKQGLGAVRDNNMAVAPGKTEERTLIMPRTLEVEGTVLDAETEQPLAGARVTLCYPRLPSLERETGATADEEGRFRVAASVGGQEYAEVRVAHEGYAEARQNVNPQTKGSVAFRLVRTSEGFEGRVVDAAGQPLGAVRVTYAWLQQVPGDEVPEATSREDGGFDLPLPGWGVPGQGFLVVAVSDAGGVGTAQASVPKKEAGRPPPLEIRLSGAGTLAGTVRDTAGQPLQGAVVSLAPDWEAARKAAAGGAAPWQVLQVINGGQYHNLTAVTGMDGTYRIPDVPALAYRVSASFGLEEAALPEPVVVAAGDTARADVSLGQGGTIEGWVLDSDSKPIPGAYVSASPQRRQGYGWWQRRPTARSQSDGKFVLRGIGDEDYTVWAYAADYDNAQHKNARRGDAEIQLRLKAKGWIEGVLQREGSPYAGMFTVTARNPRGGNGMSGRFFSGGEMIETDGEWSSDEVQRTFNTTDGRFVMRGLDAGDYHLQAATSDGLIAVPPDPVGVTDGRASRSVVLELQAGAVVTGTVRDDETGRGVPNVWVGANGAPVAGVVPPDGSARTDAQGHYEIRGLGRATYTISAWVSGTTISETLDLQPGEQRTLDLVRQAPGSLQTTVVDEEGAPLPDVRVNLRTADGNWINVNMAAMRRDGLIGDTYDWRALYNTGPEGTLTRYHVPPGVVTVSAWLRGYRMEGNGVEVRVVSGRLAQVTLTLKRNGSAPASGR